MTVDAPDDAPATGDPEPPPTHRVAVRDRRRLLAVWAFPAALLVLFAVLTALQLNGSSMAMIEPHWSSDPNLVAGTPQAIRSDEFYISSPLQLGQAARGLPTSGWTGLNDIDYAAVGGVPVRSWISVFTPINYAYTLLGSSLPAVSFAFRWWSGILLGLLGVYALLMALRPRPLFAAVLASLIALSPYVAWWGGPGAVLGLWSAAGAAVVLALRARDRRRMLLWSVAAAFLTTCAWFMLYPPWFVSLGVVVAFVVLGAAVDLRAGWRRFLAVAATTLVPTLAIIAVWFWQSRTALSAVAGTFYPGNRMSQSGTASLAVLLDAPLNRTLLDPAALSPALKSNQSEAF
jgi:hypothetical protein